MQDMRAQVEEAYGPLVEYGLWERLSNYGLIVAVATQDGRWVAKLPVPQLLARAVDRRQQADRPVEVLAVFANNRNAVRIPVLHEHPAAAIEHEPARRAQRQRPLVVVLRQFVVLLVLHDLHHPEADGENRKTPGNEDLEAGQALAGFSAVFGHRCR